MEKPYHIVGKDDTQGLASFLAKNGQALLPILIEKENRRGETISHRRQG